MVAAAQFGPAPFDLVFVDPPYDETSDDLAPVADLLAAPGRLSLGARLAFERRTGDPAPPLPEGFGVIRDRMYGQTTLWLAERS